MNKLGVTTAAFTILLIGMLQPFTAFANGNHQGAKHRAETLDRVLSHLPERFQFTNLRNIAVGPQVAAAGGASLIRSKNRVEARLMAADLNPGHAYTIWFIFFNKPAKCASTPCSDTDLATAAGAVHYGSGAIAGGNGTINVTLNAKAGGPPADAVGNPNLPKRGLVRNRGFKAEVHLVVVDHGIPMLADFSTQNPDTAGTWGYELTHALPPGPDWVRAAIFVP